MKNWLSVFVLSVMITSLACAAFDDDFESYAVGTFPSSQWIPTANAISEPSLNGIRVDPTDSSNQMLQLKSQSNWAPLAYHQFDFDSSFEIRASFYQEENCSPIIDMAPTTSWTNPSLRLFEMNSTSVKTLGQTSEVSGVLNQWNDLKIVYERDELNATMKFWLNGSLAGDFDSISFASESSAYDVRYNYLSLIVNNNGVRYGYFDDICISNEISSVTPTVPVPSAILLAGIGIGLVRLFKKK